MAQTILSYLLPFSLTLLGACCSGSRTSDQWDRLRVTSGDQTKPPKLGKGLEGRVENGMTIYTVIVDFLISKEGKVIHAEVHDSDAPQKLQWVAVRTVKGLKFAPSPQPRKFRNTFRFNGFKVDDT